MVADVIRRAILLSAPALWLLKCLAFCDTRESRRSVRAEPEWTTGATLPIDPHLHPSQHELSVLPVAPQV